MPNELVETGNPFHNFIRRVSLVDRYNITAFRWDVLVRKMKAVAFNCSPRKDGNTAGLIRVALEIMEKEGIATELVQVGGEKVRGCQACGVCREKKNGRCKYDDDIINECIAKICESDAVIIGSPTYFGDLSTEAKALVDRAGYVSRSNGGMFSRKVGAGIAVNRRAGAMHTLDSINHFFTINDMVLVGSTYWNIGVANAAGDYRRDEEGMRTIKRLGENITWLLKKIGE